MRRGIRKGSIDDVVLDSISPIVSRAAQSIAGMVAQMVAAQVEAEVRNHIDARPRRASKAKRSVRGEMTRWVADKHARRVPTFVIEATGLDTKKKIVAKFGENAVFQKGKPLPPEAEKSSTEPKPEVKAKGPIVRKKAKAA
jgi:hypothetical protein